MKLKRLFLMISIVCMSLHSMGQACFTMDLKNMHLWRGFDVADALVVASDMNVSFDNGLFTLGMWGGINSTGNYMEFDYYASFQKGKFKAALWDIYNFSDDAAKDNVEVFNYKYDETRRWFDLRLDYRISDAFPLAINVSTAVFGCDRDERNEKNRFTTYFHLEYPFLGVKKWNATFFAGVGAATALTKGRHEDGTVSRANFYGAKGGVVDVTVRGEYTVEFKQFSIPILATAMWNPQTNLANFEADIRLSTLNIKKKNRTIEPK